MSIFFNPTRKSQDHVPSVKMHIEISSNECWYYYCPEEDSATYMSKSFWDDMEAFYKQAKWLKLEQGKNG